jgi:hypothetical protein
MTRMTRCSPRPLTPPATATHAPQSRQQYFDIDGGKKHYFYYMAASRSNPATDPVVLWREWAALSAPLRARLAPSTHQLHSTAPACTPHPAAQRLGGPAAAPCWRHSPRMARASCPRRAPTAARRFSTLTPGTGAFCFVPSLRCRHAAGCLAALTAAGCLIALRQAGSLHCGRQPHFSATRRRHSCALLLMHPRHFLAYRHTPTQHTHTHTHTAMLL